MTTRMALLVLTAVGLTASPVLAGGPEAFDVGKELGGAGSERRAVSLSLVKMPEYTVNAVAVKDEVPMHRHEDGSHVLYIVSGRGTASLDGKPVALKPGVLVHIPKNVDHSIKVEGGKMTFIDFVQHPVDPSRVEKK